MANYAKYTRGAIGHLTKHFERAKEEDGQYIKFGNQDIDTSKTHLNYNLAPNHNQLDFIHQRLGEVYCMKRKDVNVMCSWIVTAPQDLKPEQEKAFFQESYNFLKEKYGQKNVISAYVHMDEKTPHMHFSFIPVVADRKHKQGEKVSAKECVTKVDLQQFHEQLQQHMTDKGILCSILNDATRNGNKSIAELKRQSSEELLAETTLKASRIVSKAKKQAQAINDSLIPVKAEYEAKKAYVDAVGKDFDLISGVEEQKGLFGKPTGQVIVSKKKWETQAVTRMDRDAQLRADKVFAENIKEFKNTASARMLTALSDRIRELEQQNTLLVSEKHDLIQQLDKSEKEIDRTIDRVNKTLRELPDNVADKFMQEWQRQNRIQHKSMER